MKNPSAGWFPERFGVRAFLRFIPALLLFSSGCALFRRPPPPPAPDRPPLIDTDQADRRPPEIRWSNRKQEGPVFLDFERVIGWTVEVKGQGDGHFSRTREYQLWGPHIGRLELRDMAGGDRVQVQPPVLMPVPEQFDTVDLWVSLGEPDQTRPIEGPGLEMLALLVDAEGRSVEVEMGSLDRRGWTLLHRRLDAEPYQDLRHPCRFAGFEVRGSSASGSEVLYLDSLSIYRERLPALFFRPRPALSRSLEPGRDAGLHSGPEQLEIPVGEDGILPPVERDRFTATIERRDSICRLGVQQKDEHLVYELNDDTGLGEVRIIWNDTEVATWRGAGVLTESPAERISVFRQEGRSLRIVYDNGAEVLLFTRGWALVADLRSRGGSARAFQAGRFQAHGSSRLLPIAMAPGTESGAPPVWTFRAEDGDGPDLFGAGWFDWTRSAASELSQSVTWTEDEGIRLGEARYLPLTEGHRNDLFERFVLVVASDVAEVLPVVPHPPGLHAQDAVPLLGVRSHTADTYGEELDRCLGLVARGISQVAYCAGAWTWRDANESGGLRIRAAPGKGGDAPLQAFIADLQQLGWTVGLSQNLRDLHPINAYWDPDAVQRLPLGTWRRAAPAHFALKAPRAVEWQAEVGEHLMETYGSRATLMAEHTMLPPWTLTDYDGRVPGAGSYLQTYLCYAEMLRDESARLDGPVYAAGNLPWLYAGLADGLVMMYAPTAPVVNEPYLPLFALQRLQPLAVRVGLGDRSQFIHPLPDMDETAWTDRYLAAQIAYGHAGVVLDFELRPDTACRSYFMMQDLQQQYLLKKPIRMAYHDGEHLVSPSEALAGPAWERSQLYLQYPGDLEIWINGSLDQNWTVRVDRDAWTLPPGGWVARALDFFELSGLVSGARRDVVDTPARLYADGRGDPAPFRGVGSAGPLLVERQSKTAWRVLDLTGVGTFTLHPACGLPGVPTAFTVDEVEGAVPRPGVLEAAGEGWSFSADPPGRVYTVHFSGESAPTETGP